MLSLFKSERFQNELKEYKYVAQQLDNPSLKKELDSLINQLVGEVRQIDIGHDSIIQKDRLGSNLGEARSRIFELRKKISKIVEDFRKTIK